jgi:alkylation response protein AidB-like acyl-CoA dehydrogenase
VRGQHVDVDEGERLARARTCQRLLHDNGFAGIDWPVEHGGQGLGTKEVVAFNQEASHYDLPITPFVIGLGMCGPTIIAHGTDDQKARYLPPLLRGDEIWCQLFSEPAAGSDLASLRTSAVEVDGAWRLTGQKVWTSGAHNAAFGMILARSDPGRTRHHGLTMFVIAMDAPGVTIRPLRQMSGPARFNEVFLDDVAVEGVLGTVGDGWRTALTTLMNERVSIGAGPSNHGVPFETLRRLPAGPAQRQELARLYGDELLVKLLGQRVTDAILAGAQPGPEGSLAKLAGTAAAKRSASLAVALAGPGPFDEALCSAPGLSIAGGTDEVLRNVIGERVLGLPREPRP